MVTHRPRVGDLYKNKDGIDGQLIAIVGHSHWLRNGDKDSPAFTRAVVGSAINGKAIAFYSQLRNYFGFSNNAELLDRVIFFNFLPSCVGSKEDRYRKASPEELKRARKRFRYILRKYRPHKVIVFSNSAGKGWRTLPDTDEERAGDRLFHLGPGILKTYTWGTYRISGHTVLAFGLRHPQGANGRHMKKAIQHILAI